MPSRHDWKYAPGDDVFEYVVKSETPVDYKTDKGKPRLALVPPIAIEAIRGRKNGNYIKRRL